jgi:hypothetical protein
MTTDRNGKQISIASMVRIHYPDSPIVDTAQVRMISGYSLFVERDTGGEFRIVAADICEVIQ